MDDREALLSNLKKIETWAETPLSELVTNDDFMKVAIAATNYTQYLLDVGLSLAPGQLQADKGFTKRRAIVLGHVVRVKKLYDAFRYHASKGEREICSIFVRPLFEAISKADYLMRAKGASFRNFVLGSFRPEKEMLEDLQAKAAVRPLLPIEKRMLRSIKGSLKEDRITLTQLKANRKWDLDGKSVRQLLLDLQNPPWGYAYMFGMASHWLHGDWFDLKTHHLNKENGRYFPKWRYTIPDPRVVCPMTILCLSFLAQFIKWNRCDPDRAILPIIQKTVDATLRIDEVHERWIQARRSV